MPSDAVFKQMGEEYKIISHIKVLEKRGFQPGTH